jgi:eukaryotic-like serine/threonine-protein kinase
MPAPGDRLVDRYRILAPLGSGGMATVLRAHDERLDRDVAIKVLLPNLASDPVLARRFEEEARAMAAVAHPGLVSVFDVDAGDPATGREPFVVMELCPGGSLADRLGPDRPMPPDELVPILVAVSDALAALHRAGLVHRDVKPSNILFATDRVKVGDFGLVRSDNTTEPSELTEPGTAVGTLGYLSPERLRGDRGGPPADVYALGTVAHLGLTGSMPRPGGSVRDVVAAASFRPPTVSTTAPALGRAFDDVVLDALAVDPNRRPDALAFGSGLGAALGRWSRSGRPGAVPVVAAAPPAADLADESDVAMARVNQRASHDVTTATAVPLEATAALDLPAPPPAAEGAPTPAPRPYPEAARRSADANRGQRIGGLAVLAALAAVALAAAITLPGLLGALGSGPAASLAVVGGASPSVSVSASVIPSASVPPSAAPSATVDPARTALDDVVAAISAAKGGPDGLKGKEANELDSAAARVRRDLDAGDRAAALKDARALDKRVRDATDKLRSNAAARLRTASAHLVDVLGG